ncbi:hypothetical protein PR001_g32687, partial [Phytophthora rubi]
RVDESAEDAKRDEPGQQLQPVKESEQPSTQAVETATSSTSGNIATMNATEMAAAIQHLMTATGLQTGATITGSERNRKKPTAKARRRPGADDEGDERTSQASRQRATTRDTPITAAREAAETTATTTEDATTSRACRTQRKWTRATNATTNHEKSGTRPPNGVRLVGQQQLIESRTPGPHTKRSQIETTSQPWERRWGRRFQQRRQQWQL